MKRNSLLSNFTNVIDDDDDLSDSQPLSLPSSNNKEVTSIDSQETTIIVSDEFNKSKRPERDTGQKGHFRSVEEIDEKYRDVFIHPYFNIVQSRIIDDALYSDKSLVVCAPTGSGKTVIFEMAIVQLLMEIEEKKINKDFKIIYMAPVKSLCTERLTEWYPKFTKLGLMCIEVTGDTDVDFSQLKPYGIIITTPEKWDMLTRRWRDYTNLVEVIKLFLIDEVHILNDDVRGPVLEAVVSRMKTIEASAKSAHRIEQLQRQYQSSVNIVETPPPKIRFIAVSATVSNPEDVATWLGTPERPAMFFKFGDECRPVKLNLVVEGYPCAEGSSIFKFDIVLNYKLWPIIQKYHNGKPTLIFCNTRKSVALTAEMLSREITVAFSNEQRAKLTALAATIKNKKIQSLVLCGVGCHHAGLLYEERVVIENAFRNKVLPFLITTTTLAMGVNLPAHLVIIKNTQQYMNGAYQEYSISTILQMVGRAGRPQFDTEATAVIMTRMVDKARYQSLVGGSEPLQSYLHKRLAENLNSEAALGTVTDVAQCVQWVNSTFLSVRAARDPRRYLGLPQNASKQLITKKIEELCVKAMNGLATSGLISMDEASCIESTDAGRLMSVYYMDVETMKAIMKLQGTETLEQLLWLVCESHELSDMHLRVDERRSLNALNRNKATETIRFPMKGKITSRQMKLNCIIQAVLGCLPIPDPSLNQEALKIMRIADRVCKCLVAYLTSGKVMAERPKCFTSVLNAVILAKCLSAHMWENSPYLSKQLKGIGPTFSSLLASAGKTSFMLLEESHPRDLERIMNKSAPAGNDLRKQISLLPKYKLTIVPMDQKSVRIKLVMLNQVYLTENIQRLTAGPNHKFYLIVGDSENNLLYYSVFKDTDFLSVYDGCITCDVTRKQNKGHKLLAHCVSSNFVGIDDNSEYTFQDLNPCTDDTFKCTQHDTVLKQTNITDVFSRKRKSPKHDITQTKEKIKRDTDVINQFKILRESSQMASKNTRDDFNKNAESRAMILNDANASVEPQNISLSQVNESLDTSNSDEHVNDDEIMNILKEIEGEIENQNINSVAKTGSSQQQHHNTENMKSITSKHRHVSFKLNKRKEPNSNFSFMKSIEQKYCQNEPAVTESDAGFSNAIKDHLNQFIVNIQHKNQNNVETDLLLENNCKPSPATPGAPQEKLRNNYARNTPPQKYMSVSKQTLPQNQLTQSNIERNNKNFTEVGQFPKNGVTIELPTQNPNNTIAQIINENNKQFSLTASRSMDKLQLNPFLPFEYSNVNLTRNDNIHEKDAELKINNSLGYNNFLLPIQTSQKQAISLIQPSSVPMQNENNNYRVLEILEPKSSDISKYRENTKYSEMEDDVDVNQYFFSATKINSCTKVLPERQLHIVGRLKVDFNVMEIKTKHRNNSECNTSNNQNIEVAEITETNSDRTTVCPDTLAASAKQVNKDKTVCNKFVEINPIEKNAADNNQNTGSDLQNKVVDVKEILRKYQSKLVSKNPSQSIDASANYSTNQDTVLEESQTVELKPKKYKISDFDNINIPLPESLSSVITESKIRSQAKCSSTKPDIINSKIKVAIDKEELEAEIDLTPKTTKESFKYIIDDDATDFPQLPTDIEMQSDCDLSQAMLNPKAFLQSVNDEIIVPPPPEFTDTYSPTYDKNDFNINNFNTYCDLDSEDSFSEEKAAVETYLNDPIEESELTRNDFLSYTPSESTSENMSWSQSLSQRKTKLSKFKFRKYENSKFKK